MPAADLEWLLISHVESYMRTPALLTAIEAWSEIEKSGHGDGGQLISSDHPALIAWDKRDQTVCGILTYNPKDWESTVKVRIGYVKASHRRYGVYTRLWQHLVARARKDKCKRIVSVMHAENAGMRRLATRLGRIQSPLVQYEQVLDDRPDFPSASPS